MFYLRRHPSGSGGASLIDPGLPIASSPSRFTAPGSGANLAYQRLSPFTRTAYLDWLAGGRRSDVPAGLVLLFCFGLERRILVDIDEDPAAQRELPLIAAEVRRLRARYGDAVALRQPLDHLLDLLELLTAPRTAPGAAPNRTTPMSVGIAVAGFAVSGTPLPMALANAWLQQHPALSSPRSMIDCPAEFERLFTHRYRERHGRGLVLSGGGPGLRLRYRPADPGLADTLVWRADLPDLQSDRQSIRALATLRDEAASDLDPYRRWLARFPQGRDTLAAVPLLPAELVDTRHGRLGAVRVWAEQRLDGRPRALIDGGDFWDFWAVAAPGRMAADEASALLSVLARLELGVEPDVRFGAPRLSRGPAALFRLGRPAADRPGPRFASAAAIVRCAAAVASATGPVDPRGPVADALLSTVTDLAAALCLEPGEDIRLAARLSWLLTTRIDVDRLARQTSGLTPAEREVAGQYLAMVAATADPVIGPAKVTVLTQVYRILGLSVELVFQRLHARATGGGPALPRLTGSGRTVTEAGQADEPVVVQTGDDRPAGFTLPWASAGPRLDQALIQRRVAESDAAATLLSTIFEEGTEEPVHEQPAPVAGLDATHSALLRALGERPAWTREEFESVAAAHGLLPAGALDMLNEAAIDATGDPVIEGDAIITVAIDVLLELSA